MTEQYFKGVGVRSQEWKESEEGRNKMGFRPNITLSTQATNTNSRGLWYLCDLRPIPVNR